MMRANEQKSSFKKKNIFLIKLNQILLFIRRKISGLILNLSAKRKFSKTTEVKSLYFNLEAFKEAKKTCFFSHYSKEGEVSDHVEHYLNSLKDCGFTIAFCSTSPQLSAGALSLLQKKCDLILLRENVGLDFGSWASCFRMIEKSFPDYMNQCPGLLWANDSVIGPLYPLPPIFKKMEMGQFDYWSLTENHYPSTHLQSYFLYFQNNLIKSPFFREFVTGIKDFYDRKRVIVNYEIGLSQLLSQRKWKRGVAFPYNEIFALEPDRVPRNQYPYADPTLFFWDLLIEKLHFPFLKRSVVRFNPQGVLRYNEPQKLIDQVMSDKEGRFVLTD